MNRPEDPIMTESDRCHSFKQQPRSCSKGTIEHMHPPTPERWSGDHMPGDRQIPMVPFTSMREGCPEGRVSSHSPPHAVPVDTCRCNLERLRTPPHNIGIGRPESPPIPKTEQDAPRTTPESMHMARVATRSTRNARTGRHGPPPLSSGRCWSTRRLASTRPERGAGATTYGTRRCTYGTNATTSTVHPTPDRDYNSRLAPMEPICPRTGMDQAGGRKGWIADQPRKTEHHPHAATIAMQSAQQPVSP